MGVFRKALEIFKSDFSARHTDVKAVGAAVSYGLGGLVRYPTADYGSLSREVHRKNELAYAGLMRIINSFAQAPLRVRRPGDPEGVWLSDHPLRNLIVQPNEFWGEYGLWESTLGHKYLSGNGYWEKVRSGSGRVVELWPLRPDRVRIVPHETRYISHYVFDVRGRTWDIDPEDIVHFRSFHPLDDYYGMSPWVAARRAVATDNEATDFTGQILKNSAVPGVAIESDKGVDESKARSIIAKFKAKYGGRRRGEPIVLQQGMKVQPISHNMQELAMPDLRALGEARILSVIGVPPILVGAKVGLDRSTFTNATEARISFQEDTIAPLQNRMDDPINRFLVEEFGAGFEVSFDISQVPAVADRERLRKAEARKNYLANLWTQNEARAWLGMPPVPGGDVFRDQGRQIPDEVNNNDGAAL